MHFSTVITTYNRVSLLQRAVESALAQTTPCEVIVIDDCSTDGTEEYVHSLGNQVVYHRHASNQGHATSVNIGVELAQGDWIKPLDDDDYLAPDCLAQMQRAIALCPNPVLCSGQAAQVDLEGRKLSCTPAVGPGHAFYIPQSDVHYAMLLERAPLGTTTQVAFQRQAFLDSGGWNPTLDVNSDDSDSWIRIAQFGDVIFVNDCLAYRTIWPGAYNYRISVRDRLESNRLVKAQIYQFIHAKYQGKLPSLATVEDYLYLHWGIVALRNQQIGVALRLLNSGIWNLRAWQILLQAIQFRRSQTPDPDIATLTLIDASPVALSAPLVSEIP